MSERSKQYRTIGWFLRCNLWSYGLWFGLIGILELYFYHVHGDPIYWETFHLLVGLPVIPSVLFGCLLWMSLAYPSKHPSQSLSDEWERVYMETWDAMRYATDRLPTAELREEFSQNVKKYIKKQLDKRGELS